MSLAGPEFLRLAFHIFVVMVGDFDSVGRGEHLMIGANGVLNRVAEDGVLLEWFRKPHHRFGTTYRIINLITVLQIGTILASRGDVYLLGEAYAFGVVWSFFLKGLGVSALRFQRHDQEYKTPLNIGLEALNSDRADFDYADAFPRRYGEPVHQADRHGLRHHVHDHVVALFSISDRVNARRRKAQKGAGGVQPRAPAGDQFGKHSRSAWMCAGRRSRLQSHGPFADGSWKKRICAVTTSS